MSERDFKAELIAQLRLLPYQDTKIVGVGTRSLSPRELAKEVESVSVMGLTLLEQFKKGKITVNPPISE